MLEGLEAIFWDNDGVLVDTEALYFRATREVIAKVGIEFTREMYVELNLKRSMGAWHLAAERGVSAERIAAYRRERDDLYARMLAERSWAIDGAAEALAALHGWVRMAVVTSTHRDHFEIAHRSTGFSRYFEFVLTQEDYERSKPDPQPYLRALERVGLPAEQCLVIEDSERGLVAAKRAGIVCWVIPSELTRGSDFSAADHRLASIRDVPRLVLGR